MLFLSTLWLLPSLIHLTMASSNATPPTTNATATTPTVTRVACFKFHANVTDAQKAGRTSAFLDLYAQHQDLILGMPKGGRPLNTPLALTNVKREKGWDTGFVVVFKVCCVLGWSWVE